MCENTCQNDNNDWSLFYRTTSDKLQVTGQLQQSDRQTWAICQVFVCFTKTFSCHTHLSLLSIFWLR